MVVVAVVVVVVAALVTTGSANVELVSKIFGGYVPVKPSFPGSTMSSELVVVAVRQLL